MKTCFCFILLAFFINSIAVAQANQPITFYHDKSTVKISEVFSSSDYKTALLTNETVREFMSRFDTGIEQHNQETIRLYTNENWTVTYTYQKDGKPVSKTMNKTEIIGEMNTEKTKNYKHSRKIYNITILDNGQSAEVESYESESGIAKGKSFIITEHSLDNLAIENGSIVLTKSLSDLDIQAASSTGNKTSANCCKSQRDFWPSFWTALTSRLLAIGIFYVPVALGLILWGRKRLWNFRSLLASGTHTKGRIVSAKSYTAKGGAGLAIDYEFQSDLGIPQKGKTRIIKARLNDEQTYVSGRPIGVTYLAAKPKISAISDLIQAKIDSALSYNRKLAIWTPIIIFSTVASALYLFFEYGRLWAIGS